MAGRLFLGLDAGGTSTSLLAEFVAGNGIVEHDTWSIEGRHANPQRYGIDGAADVLADMIREALEKVPSDTVVHICGGVAGADSKPLERDLAERLHDRLAARPPKSLVIVHDSVIAIEAAFGPESGLIIIAGTGSGAFARDKDGSIQRVGGFGYLLGDEGSGYALGRAVLRAALADTDGGPSSVLRELVLDARGISDTDTLLRSVYEQAWPLQSVAGLLFQAVEAEDEVACHILRSETMKLAIQVERLASRCTGLPQRAVLFGGLGNHPLYVSYLRDSLTLRLPEWTLEKASVAPVDGALELARRNAQLSR
jgi:glucosamine kinase